MAEIRSDLSTIDWKQVASPALGSSTCSSHFAPGEEATAAPSPQLVPAPVHTFHKPAREVFISYAWGDDSPSGKERQRIVDRLVETLRSRAEEITVRIDRDELRPGDLISAFMDCLSAADRVIVVISAKYLRSEYCMYELFKIYQNCRMKAHDFQPRIIPIILPDAGLSGGPAGRLRPAIYWDEQAQELAPLVENNFHVVSPAFLTKYRLIGEFARNSSDIIEYLTDQLQLLMKRRMIDKVGTFRTYSFS